MAAPIVLIGTGTSVGKTHTAERLLRAFAALGASALGYKPVESGIRGDEPDSDFARLEAASSFHVKQTLRYALAEPISPHLAARAAGVRLDVDRILAEVDRLVRVTDILLVELPGGAFSPFTDDLAAIDLARKIPHALLVLVAPDRLGVLHDLGACARAAASAGAPIHGIILNAPSTDDASTGRNAAEVPLVTRVPVLASLPRSVPRAAIENDDPVLPLARQLLAAARSE
jgi:dethiobiotin synthetase